VIGEPRTHVAECESTQLLLGPDDPEGAIATTDHQTAGRGRRGRRWTEAPGTAVLVSVLLRPPAERSAPELSLVAAAAVALALEDVTGRAAQVKWPNDVLFGGRKAAGILAEAKGAAVVLGIGVNVNQAPGDLPEPAKLAPVSLRALDGVERDREAVLAAVLRRLDGSYAAWREGGLAAVHADLTARDFLRGRRVRTDAVAGVAAGIDAAGRLLVTTEGGATVAVESGEITLLDRSA
jgi:BirA family transcriptional regulator, biotin operon repressor / biotin---[acetyl-CoA-carboxylase] ligase